MEELFKPFSHPGNLGGIRLTIEKYYYSLVKIEAKLFHSNWAVLPLKRDIWVTLLQ